MAEESGSEYVCTLSPKLLEKAEKDLNEKPEFRSRDIQAIRKMVEKHSELKIRTDDAFLLRFLRARKFDYERSFQLILTHYKMKIEHEEIFKDLRPSAVKHILQDGVTGILPHRDKLGRRVIMFRPGKWDPTRFPIDDVFRTNFMTMSKIIQEEETQVNGIIMVIDLKEMGWSHAMNFSPLYARRVGALLQDAFPARIKGIHIFHEPLIFDYIYPILKQFLKAKTVNRLHFHSSKVEELKEYVDEEYLPEDYGGKQPPYSNKDWADKLLQCDAEFDEEAKYGLIDLGAKQTSSQEDAIDGTVGSFKKLNV